MDSYACLIPPLGKILCVQENHLVVIKLEAHIALRVPWKPQSADGRLSPKLSAVNCKLSTLSAS